MFIKDNHGTWIKGLTWTKGYSSFTTNPDGTVGIMWVHGGAFYWNQFSLWEGRYLEFYIGFRPTPTWGIGYGNEGDGIFTKIGQFLKKHGWGNLGFALRLKRSGAWKIQ